MDLSGTWRAAVADEALRRTFAEPAIDDAGWDGVHVPGEWDTPAAAMLYRRRFSAPGPEHGRSWLVFDGIRRQGDVWLDGTYLGDTEGAFARHTFEVTDALAATNDHVLAVDVVGDGESERGGIWRGVRIEHTGPVRARSLRVLCREATAERAVVGLRAELDSDAARTVEVRTTIGDTRVVTDHAEFSIAKGSNFVEWTIAVTNPARWWPHALGDQPLHEVHVEVMVDGASSHTVHRRVGLRTVAMHNGILTVNGERLFVKGARGMSIAHARDAGFDLVRLDGIAPDEVYDAADELGVLVWQDFQPAGTRKQAARQANAAVDLLGHHPALAIWSPGRSVKRAVEKADRTRPALTPGWPHVEDPVALARAIPRLVRFVADLGGGTDAPARIETLRRIKYRPTGGFCLTELPANELAVVDACRPLIVVADQLPADVAPGDALAVDVHVVSDLRAPLEGARVDAVLGWRGGSHDWHWEGDIPADACVLVGTLQAVVPDVPGELTLDLTLHAGDHVATNARRATVVSCSPDEPG